MNAFRKISAKDMEEWQLWVLWKRVGALKQWRWIDDGFVEFIELEH